MQRRTADTVVGGAIALVIVVGLLGTWQAWQTSRQTSSGMMMDGTMMNGMNTGPSPIWILFGTVAIAAIIAVGYVVVREGTTRGAAPRFERSASEMGDPGDRSPPERQMATNGAATAGVPAGGTDESNGEGAEPTPEADETSSEGGAAEPSGTPGRPAILDVLPEDERRILEPVVESPGLTQIELRDRADFSKSKVSQTVSDLEKRGLLSRERQGRTYRIYPTDDLVDDR